MLKIVFCHHLSEYSCKECLVIYYLCTVDIYHEEILFIYLARDTCILQAFQ